MTQMWKNVAPKITNSAKVFDYSGTSYAARTYAGISGSTGSNGQVTFNLPAGTYWFGLLIGGAYMMEASTVSCTTPT